MRINTQIQTITGELHERMQFYDANGNPANAAVLDEMAGHLHDAFIGESADDDAKAEYAQEIADGLHG